jgi:phosphate transport system permease protein
MLDYPQRNNCLKRWRNKLFTLLCYASALFGLFILACILWSLLDEGFGAVNLQVFTQSTPPPGQAGGLLNAIYGSFVMTGIAMLIAAPLGILIATFMVEFNGRRRMASVVRFVNDIMLSAPSIVIGLFVYALMVSTLGHFSALAGAVALAVIALPMVVRTTEDVLYLISPQLREAAVALGVSRWRVTILIVYRAAISGIITAVLLAMARIAGETAPLLFTALNNQFFSADMMKPMANLPVVIFQYAMSPYEGWRHLAWVGALLITLTILILNLIARAIAKRKG